VIYIPKTLALFLKFEAGKTLHVRIVPNGEYFDAPVREYGRGSLAILVPRAVLVKHGLTPVPTKKQMDAGATWDGETIDVPFGDWTVVGTTAPAKPSSPVPRSKRATKTAKKSKKAAHAEDHEDTAHAKRDKKSPRAHAGHKGHAHGRGQEDDHHRAYGEVGRHVLVG
jgi:hypothetical protein